MTAALFPILNLAAESAVLFALVFILARLLSPRIRVFVLRCLFAVALVAPFAVLIAGQQASLMTVHVPMAADPAPLRLVPAIPFVAAASAPAAVAATGPQENNWAALIFVLWLVGAVFVLGRYLLSHFVLSRSYRAGHHAGDEIGGAAISLAKRLRVSAPVGVLMSADVVSPCTFGWIAPKILLPQHLSDSGAALDAILAHELCHVRNRDAFWLMLGHMACALYWFNPLIWLCAAAHRMAFEFVCDEDATQTVVDTKEYLVALLRTAQQLLRPPAGAGVTMSAQGLSARVRALMQRDTPMTMITPVARAAVLAGSAFVLTLLASVDVVSAKGMWNQREEALLRPGEAMLYVETGAGITVWGRDNGFMCGDRGSCLFTVPANTDLKLTTDGDVAWTGCTPSSDAKSCTLRIDGRRARVEAFASR